MDVNIIMQAIGTLGFPIVAAGAMFWLVNKQNDQHKEEMNVVMEALNANTLALVELKEAQNANTLALVELKNALEDRKE